MMDASSDRHSRNLQKKDVLVKVEKPNPKELHLLEIQGLVSIEHRGEVPSFYSQSIWKKWKALFGTGVKQVGA